MSDEIRGLVMVGRFEGVEQVTNNNTGEVIARKRQVKIGWESTSGREAAGLATYWTEDRYGEQSDPADFFENHAPAQGTLLCLHVRPAPFSELSIRRVEVLDEPGSARLSSAS